MDSVRERVERCLGPVEEPGPDGRYPEEDRTSEEDRMPRTEDGWDSEEGSSFEPFKEVGAKVEGRLEISKDPDPEGRGELIYFVVPDSGPSIRVPSHVDLKSKLFQVACKMRKGKARRVRIEVVAIDDRVRTYRVESKEIE
jgi:hypothetical protein